MVLAEFCFVKMLGRDRAPEMELAPSGLPKSLTLERVIGSGVNERRSESPFASNHSGRDAPFLTVFEQRQLRPKFVVDNPNPPVYNAADYGRRRLPIVEKGDATRPFSPRGRRIEKESPLCASPLHHRFGLPVSRCSNKS